MRVSCLGGDNFFSKSCLFRYLPVLAALLLGIGVGYAIRAEKKESKDIERSQTEPRESERVRSVPLNDFVQLQEPNYPLKGWVRKSPDVVPPFFNSFTNKEADPSSDPDPKLVALCTVSDFYEFVFVNIHKSGSTFVHRHLKNQLRGLENSEDNILSCTSPLLSVNDMISETKVPGSQIQCNTIPRWKFEEYIVFTFVRNSWSRAVSSYQLCHLSSMNVSWHEWCQNIDISGQCLNKAPKEVPAPISKSAPQPSSQWAPQLHRICNTTGSCIVDFVGHFDTIAEDYNELVRVINQRKEAGLPDLEPMNATNSTTLEYVKWYSGSPSANILSNPAALQHSSDCNKSISEAYGMDVEAFGFEFGHE